jgi:hypothetical protein
LEVDDRAVGARVSVGLQAALLARVRPRPVRLRVDWQVERERAADSLAALRGQRAAVLLHDLARTRQPDACATNAAYVCGAEEALEHVLHFGCGDAKAAITHPHGGHRAPVRLLFRGDLNGDLAAVGTVLDRIR